jgi:hypothetical protein
MIRLATSRGCGFVDTESLVEDRSIVQYWGHALGGLDAAVEVGFEVAGEEEVLVGAVAVSERSTG